MIISRMGMGPCDSHQFSNQVDIPDCCCGKKVEIEVVWTCWLLRKTEDDGTRKVMEVMVLGKVGEGQPKLS